MSRIALLALLPLLACAEGAPVEVAPAPLATTQAALPLNLSTSPFVYGQPATVTVDGANPGETVFLAWTATGIGPGVCPAVFNGPCLDLLGSPQVLGQVAADGAGTATFNLNVPATLPLSTVYFQAVVLRSTAELSSPVQVDFLSAGDTDGDGLSDVDESTLGTDATLADTDGDGLDDGEEVTLIGTDPLLADTDGGGADDGTEFTGGTDPLTAGDDVLFGLSTLDATIDVDIDFSGGLAGFACAFAGVCDCVATYEASGAYLAQDGLELTFDGTWTLASTTCSAAVGLDTQVWVPSTGDSFHTLTFGAGAATLEQWVAHADLANSAPTSDPVANEQFVADGGSTPWNGVDPITFSGSETDSQNGVDVTVTSTGTITLQ